VRELINKFQETGSVCDNPSDGRLPVLTQEKIKVSDRMLQSPGKSVRKLAQETGLSVYLLIQRL
jgi:hypothetical protein